MKKISILVILLAACLMGYAQKTVNLQINHKLDTAEFAMNKAAKNNIGTNFNVKRLEYYISEISIVHDGGTETKIEDFWILENAGTRKKHDLGKHNISKVDSVKFSIGVNPEVNHADPSTYPSGHPLAPKSPSMHWGWAAGYRFVAIEGKAGLDLNKTFEIHALGDDNYFSLSIPASGSDDNGDLLIQLNADYAASLANIDVSKNVVTHGDYAEAVVLLKNFWTDVFTSMEGGKNTLDIEQIKRESALVFPNPSVDGIVNLNFEENSEITLVQIMSIDGTLVSEFDRNKGSNIQIELNKGFYVARLLDSENNLLGAQKIIVH